MTPETRPLPVRVSVSGLGTVALSIRDVEIKHRTIETRRRQHFKTAILDRLLHHRHVLTSLGDSYRLRAKRNAASSKCRPPVTPLCAGGAAREHRPPTQRHEALSQRVRERTRPAPLARPRGGPASRSGAVRPASDVTLDNAS